MNPTDLIVMLGFGAKNGKPDAQAAQLVGEHRAGDELVRGNGHLERISLHLAGDRTCEAQARLLVVKTASDDECRPPTALLMTLGGVQFDPDEVAGVGTTRLRCRRVAPSRFRRDGSPR